MKIILRKFDLSFLFKLLKKSRLNNYFNKGKGNMETGELVINSRQR